MTAVTALTAVTGAMSAVTGLQTWRRLTGPRTRGAVIDVTSAVSADSRIDLRTYARPRGRECV